MFVYGPYEKKGAKGMVLYFLEWISIILVMSLALYMLTGGELSLLSAGLLSAAAALFYLLLKIIIKAVGEERLSTEVSHRILGILILVFCVAAIPFAFSGMTSASVNILTGEAPFSVWAIIAGLFTIVIIAVCERKGTQLMRVFSPLIGMVAGCALASFISVIGGGDSNQKMLLVDFSVLDNLEVIAGNQPTISEALAEIKALPWYNLIPCLAYMLAVIFTIIELHNDEKLESGRMSTKKGMILRAVIIVVAAALMILMISIRSVAAVLSMTPICVLAGVTIGTAIISIVTGFYSMTNKG